MSRMRASLIATGLVVALMALTSWSKAQAPAGSAQRGSSRGGFGQKLTAPLSLLSLPEVQKDLKLTGEQLKNMDRAKQDTKKTRGEQFDAMRKHIANGGPPPDYSVFRESMKAMRAEDEAAVTRFLSRAQRNRLQQIVLQHEGPLAVARPEIQEKLNINPAQSAQIELIMEQMNEARGHLSQNSSEMFSQLLRPADGNVDRAAMRARLQSPAFETQVEKAQVQMKKVKRQSDQVEQEAIREIGRVLTKKQKLAFNKMLGEPLNLGPETGQGDSGAGGNPKKDTKSEAAPDSAPAPDRKSQREPGGSGL